MCQHDDHMTIYFLGAPVEIGVQACMIMRDRNFFIDACSMKLIHGQEPLELHKKNKKKDARFNPMWP